MEWLDRVIYGNSVSAWLLALGAAALAWLVLRVVRFVLAPRLVQLASRTAVSVDDLLARLVAGTSGALIFVVALTIGGLVLTLPAGVERALRVILTTALAFQIGLWGSAVITFGVGQYGRRKLDQDPATFTTISMLSFMGRLLLWSLLLLLALDNVGVDITALVAGLGIGGIAVALALQNVLGDLFAAFSIALDRPFSIGDFLIVGEVLGTVEHIGLKTTRLRSLTGEQVVMSNGDLLDSRIRNYKRMVERRAVFTLGVTYDTLAETLAAIPSMLQEAVEAQPLVRFERAHFKSYGDFALIFEVVYYVLSPDYNTYMDIQQAINLEINRRFAAGGIEFAYPTQTLYLRRNDAAAPVDPAAVGVAARRR